MGASNRSESREGQRGRAEFSDSRSADAATALMAAPRRNRSSDAHARGNRGDGDPAKGVENSSFWLPCEPLHAEVFDSKQK